MLGLFSSTKRQKKKVHNLLEIAKKAYDEQDYEIAFSNFSQAASLKSIEAEYWLGLCCLAGYGTIVSINQAVLWLQSAGNSGHSNAQYTLALVYMQGVPEVQSASGMDLFENVKENYDKLEPDFVSAREWAKKSAENNLAEGQALYAYLLSQHENGAYIDEALEWYDKAIAQKSPQGYMGKGLLLSNLAQNDDDFAKAAELLEIAAEHKMASAIHRLGIMYEKGIGVPANQERAAELYQQAAELGIRDAQALYGAILNRGQGIEQNTIQAATWLRRAALKGDIEAAASLADMYAQGSDSMPPNYTEAAQWYQVAADAGHAGAAYSLGGLFLQGIGVPKSFDTAIKYFTLSAQKGFVRSIITLSELAVQLPEQVSLEEIIANFLLPGSEQGFPILQYHLGIALLKIYDLKQEDEKLEEARKWLQLSAAHIPAAKFWYGKVLIQGLGGPVEFDEGYQLIKEAAEAGEVEAQYMWANFLLDECKNGNANAITAQEALKFYQLAAEQNHVRSMFSLAAMYGGGNFIEAERQKAQEWFQKAADLGHAQAQLMLGRYLLYGFADVFDLEKAEFWLNSAKEKGLDEAHVDLEYLEIIKNSEEDHKTYILNHMKKNEETSISNQSENEGMLEVAPGLFFLKQD